MKTTQYLTYLKTMVLIISIGLYFADAAVIKACDKGGMAFGLISAKNLEHRGGLMQGYLTVYSATDRAEDGGLEYHAHSSYVIYTVDGKLFKSVDNHMSATDEIPEMVALPVGSYIVAFRPEMGGYSRRLVTIGGGSYILLGIDRN